MELETQRLIRQMDLTDLTKIIPDLPLLSLLQSAANGTLYEDSSNGLHTLVTALCTPLRALIPRGLRILGISILCAGLTNLRTASASNGIAQLTETLCCLSLAVPIAGDFTTLFSQAKQAAASMCQFYQTLLPTMLALLTAIGGERSALFFEETSLTVMGLLTQAMQGILLPALGIGAALAAVCHVAPEIRLGRALHTLRTLIHWALGLCFTVFLGLTTIPGTAAAHYDGMTVRTAKYAVDQLIPVVGGAFKDTADTLIGCSIVVKNAVGVVGLSGIVLLLLKPCTGILSALFLYRLCAALLEPLNCTRISAMLGDFSDCLTTLFIVMISIGAIFFVFLAELMRIGTGFV